jgi:hypothetical protein
MAMERSKTLPVVKSPAGVPHPELDLAGGTIGQLKWEGRKAKYVVGRQDVGRADLIAHKVYGEHRFWWALMAFNDIHDVWNDLYPGLVLECPPRDIIEKWQSRARQAATKAMREK